ncbi:triphosphoribosyl-dephospho-CoA synthase [Methylobacter sp. sgz302048]|uniref:triphosphoribosyl-dephospho-CoA synthase n=1 Tax=Methylobacter sp. sgz302048 TaxID=3455945 RepID=UPI003FA050BB
MISAKQLSDLYRLACEVELEAFKPGNVSIYADGHDMTVADFIASAEVSAGPLCDPDYSLGEKIYYAVKATRTAVGCNTNLGILLLCAPLVQAVNYCGPGVTLRQAVHRIVANTTVEDADWVFKAIALASPGGLGESEEQDVHEKPSVTLTEAMKIASAKDRIALQYVTDYKDIFDFSVLRYNVVFDRWGDRNWAAVAVYADLLSRFPDSHIERKYGNRYSEMVATRMALVSEELSKTDDPEQLKPLLYRIDQEFKLNGINPGTTADLTVATVLTIFLEDLIGKL